MIINLIVYSPDWFRGPNTRYWRLLCPNCDIRGSNANWVTLRESITPRREIKRSPTRSWVGLQLLRHAEATISSKTSRPTYIKPLCTPMAQRTWRSFILQVRAAVYPSVSVHGAALLGDTFKSSRDFALAKFSLKRRWNARVKKKYIEKLETEVCICARGLKW